MKILIIALARSGSTSLMKNIAKENNLNPMFEPFNYNHENKNIYNSNDNNIVLKTLVGQYPNSEPFSNLETLKKWEDWIVDFSKDFDKVIILSRKNLNNAAESFSVASINNNWFDKYEYTELPNLLEAKKHIYYTVRFLKNVSIRLNIPFTYYEDIFDENSKDRLRQTFKN